MTSPRIPTFGDNVRVRNAPATEEAGVAGCAGQVYGETTPSVTGVEVIGNVADDYALNVQLDGHDNTYWFAPELLEIVDHAPGTELRLDGVKKKWVRREDGSWDEQEDPSPPRGKPWWRFW